MATEDALKSSGDEALVLVDGRGVDESVAGGADGEADGSPDVGLASNLEGPEPDAGYLDPVGQDEVSEPPRLHGSHR